jgi:DNA polymerase I-like protein with 3'-5' exonuclease and polymerase domains
MSFLNDEAIVRVPQGNEDETKQLMLEAIDAVNNKLNLNVPLGIDPKFGSRYSEIH